VKTDNQIDHILVDRKWHWSAVAYPEIFFGGGLTNSVDRGQREQGSGGGSLLVRGSAQFANW
jgi:hypothetical protein